MNAQKIPMNPSDPEIALSTLLCPYRPTNNETAVKSPDIKGKKYFRFGYFSMSFIMVRGDRRKRSRCEGRVPPLKGSLYLFRS